LIYHCCILELEDISSKIQYLSPYPVSLQTNIVQIFQCFKINSKNVVNRKQFDLLRFLVEDQGQVPEYSATPL